MFPPVDKISPFSFDRRCDPSYVSFNGIQKSFFMILDLCFDHRMSDRSPERSILETAEKLKDFVVAFLDDCRDKHE